tara:strand:- start:5217 stop:6494 length:1278 start_codon:yes stop_codon:yes gene_type:complete
MTDIFTVNLPDIGEGVVEGEVVEWLKKEGDVLAQDEPVVQVMTDKATVELPAVYPGVLSKQYISVGSIAVKDKPLYDITLDESVEAKGAKPAEAKKPDEEIETASAAEEAPQALKEAAQPAISRPTGQKALATPATRHYARSKNVDINLVPGSGKGGRVTKADIDVFLSGGSSGPVPIFAGPNVSTPVHNLEGDERVPLKGVRKIIAERMVESKHIVPHFAYFDEVDLTQLVKLRKKLKADAADRGTKLTYLPFFVKAISNALLSYPQANSSIDLSTQEIVYHKVHNFGIAVATENGLIVPVVRDVRSKTLMELADEINDLATRTKEGKAKPEELKGSTITISNIGAIGGLFVTPIINYPEVAILGMTKLQERPVVRNGEIVVRSMMNLAWCFDHRVVDGAVSAEFSNEIIRYLESPGRLLLDSR